MFNWPRGSVISLEIAKSTFLMLYKNMQITISCNVEKSGNLWGILGGFYLNRPNMGVSCNKGKSIKNHAGYSDFSMLHLSCMF